MSKLNFTNIFSKMNKVNINRKLFNIERTSNKNMFSVQNKKNITDRYVPGSSENKSMFESMMKDEKYDLIDVARKIAKGIPNKAESSNPSKCTPALTNANNGRIK